MKQAAWAREKARDLLEGSLPRRWAHTQGVAAQARTLAPVLDGRADLLEAAAWLHDVGYSPGLVDSGFHPLDGARHLRDVEHADDLLCSLVAHHSCALIEAEERGLSGILLQEFLPPRRDLADALIYCDMTTSPDGQRLTVQQRLSEITARYGPGDVVTRSVERSSPMLEAAVYGIRRKLAAPLPLTQAG